MERSNPALLALMPLPGWGCQVSTDLVLDVFGGWRFWLGGAMRWLLITCVAFGLLTAGCRSVDEEPNHSGPPTFQGVHIP
jgi:hypothetical protein